MYITLTILNKSKYKAFAFVGLDLGRDVLLVNSGRSSVGDDFVEDGFDGLVAVVDEYFAAD